MKLSKRTSDETEKNNTPSGTIEETRDARSKTGRLRRFKHGGLAVLLAAVVIAAAIIVNVLFTSLTQQKLWYTDLTGSQLYTVTDDAAAYLDYVMAPITIKFCVPLDTIYSNSSLYPVYITAVQFAALSTTNDPDDKIPDITVEAFDSYKEPSKFEKYKGLTSDAWADTNVIIERTVSDESGEQTGFYPLVYKIASFFTTSSDTGDTIGYNGERRFILAFLQLAGNEKPIVAFTTGHGEPIGTSSDSSTNEYQDFFNLLEEFGYEIQRVDLSKEELDSRTRLVVILDPQRDFLEKPLDTIEANSEVDKIDRFVNNYGSLMVFVGATGTEYPVLNEYLSEWGVNVVSTRTIIDTVNSNDASDETAFSVGYTTSGLGASVQKKYRDQRTKFSHAAPVNILWTEKETATMTISSSFVTSSSAKAYATDTDYITAAQLNSKRYDESDGFDLFVVSSKMKYENNEECYSYVLTCGCPDMLKYCASQSFANRGILNVLITKIPLSLPEDDTGMVVPVNLDYKALEDYGLTSVTSSDVRAWTIVLAVVIPLVVMAAGITVVVVRKRG